MAVLHACPCRAGSPWSGVQPACPPEASVRERAEAPTALPTRTSGLGTPPPPSKKESGLDTLGSATECCPITVVVPSPCCGSPEGGLNPCGWSLGWPQCISLSHRVLSRLSLAGVCVMSSLFSEPAVWTFVNIYMFFAWLALRCPRANVCLCVNLYTSPFSLAYTCVRLF